MSYKNPEYDFPELDEDLEEVSVGTLEAVIHTIRQQIAEEGENPELRGDLALAERFLAQKMIATEEPESKFSPDEQDDLID